MNQELRNKYKFKKSLKGLSAKYILAAGKFNYYLECQNPEEIIQIAKTYGSNNCIAEVNQNLTHINCFFDFDSKDQFLSVEEQKSVKDDLKTKIMSLFPFLQCFIYIKDSSSQQKNQTSLHFIIRLYTQDNQPVYFRNKRQIDQFFKFLRLEKPFDVDAHKGFCLRVLFSNKHDQSGQLVDRCFKRSPMSDTPTFLKKVDQKDAVRGHDPEGDLQSLVCYCPDQETSLYIDEYVQRQYMLNIIREVEFEKQYQLSDIQKRPQDDHLSLQLTEKKCHNRSHVSNNCVCMLFKDKLVIKCHDEECKSLILSLNIGQFQILELRQSNETQSDKLKLSKEQEDVMNAHNQINLTKNQTGSDINQIVQLEKGGFKALVKHPEFSGLDQELRHLIGENKIVKYHIGGKIVEFAQSQKLQQALQKLDKTYDQREIQKIINVYNQYNININVQNIYQGSQEEAVSGKNLSELFDSCVQKLKNQYVCKLDQQIVQNIEDLVIKGAKVRCFQNIIQILQKGKFIALDKDLYYYNQNTNNWTCNDGINVGQGYIRDIISEFLFQIQQTIQDSNDKITQKLYQKISDITMKQIENIPYVTYLYLLRIDGHEFDITNNLIFFKDSTYNLTKHQFIDNNPSNYNTQAIKYPLNNLIYNSLQSQMQELNQIIHDILPNNNVFNWFLFSIAQNLVICSKQKPIIFMKGVGSNGKSFLIQLIRNTLGSYCFKGSSSIFQKDSIQDHNKATGTLEDAINSRICYIEELSSTQINIEKLKELTGGGMIPVRKNNKDFKEKEIRCQFYVACNNIPNFGNNIDQAIKNRILAVPFDTEFVDYPETLNQRKKIENVSNLAKQEQYQQAFMFILLNHLKIPQQIPNEVKMFSEELKQDIDPTNDIFEDSFQRMYDQRDQNNELYYVTKDQFRKFIRDKFNHIISDRGGKDPYVEKFKKWLEMNDCLEEGQPRINGQKVRVYYKIRLLN